MTFLYQLKSEVSVLQLLKNHFWTPYIFDLALRIISVIANALIVLAFVGPVWTFATEKRIDFKGYWTTLKHCWFKFFIYLLVFEIVIAQLTVFYQSYVLWPAWTSWQLETIAPTWRDQAMPEVLYLATMMPLTFAISLIWFAAIAVFFGYLSSNDDSTGVPMRNVN